ncbi:hypothetical protein AA11826_0256 [Komagataeibacter oboediens DSM 11826]|uniref:hypothetical protein n=1 Tax=Komagataeibacter oboediens TaxID=65958 RepID=UPI000D7C8A83|nr:hypothetical protein [Komagataeibacter oboediens]GBR28319.1 hypothetical protein AA11826_0256 [Komagataeibacter oboediens DSM 11826]
MNDSGDDDDDFALQELEKLRQTIIKSQEAYSRITDTIPEHVQFLERSAHEIKKSADEVKESCKDVTGYISGDRKALIWTCSASALLLVFVAAFLGYTFGHRGGYAEGLAEIQQQAKARSALAEWAASSPSGALAYQMDQTGEVQAFGRCQIEGYHVVQKNGGHWCTPMKDTGGGPEWSLPSS